MTRSLILVTIAVLYWHSSFSQRFLSVSSGERSQVNSIYMNPASIGGSNDKYLISLASANLLLDNNLGQLKSLGLTVKTLKQKNAGIKNVITYTDIKQFSMLAPMAEVRGPGVIYAISNEHSLALTTRLRFFNQFYNFNKLLFNVAIKSPEQASLSADMKNFKWSASSWSEVGFTYGGILKQGNNYQVKVGVTLRLLGGIGYFGLNGKHYDIKLTSGVDSIVGNNADLEFSSSLTGADNSFSMSNIIGNVLGGAGRGLGGDAGIMVISLLPDESSTGGGDNSPSSPNYKYAFSIAVSDIGAITYKNIINTHVMGDGVITTKGLSGSFKSYVGLIDYMSKCGYSTESEKKANIVYLPTALVTNLDYRIYKGLYANFIFTGNMATNGHFGSRFYTQYTVLPHYDTRLFSVGLPVSYNTLAKNVRVGLGFRYSSFFLGSDDIMMLFMNGQYGVNIYLGAAIGIHGRDK